MIRKTQISFFMTSRDELAIAEAVARALPQVRLLDDWAWESVNLPPVRPSPLDCGRAIGIWHSGVRPEIEGVARGNGVIDGPASGAIVQWLRCRLVEGVLKHGRWAATFDPTDEENAAFVRTLWNVLRAETTNRLRRISDLDGQEVSEERRFRIGADALDGARRGLFLLKADALVLAPE